MKDLLCDQGVQEILFFGTLSLLCLLSGHTLLAIGAALCVMMNIP